MTLDASDALVLSPWLLGVCAAVIGLCIGSFLNVCIYRLPRGQSVLTPRSRCGACGAAIAWYDNIPVLSFVLLGGRCRACRAGIALRYPLVELLTAVLFGVQAWTLVSPAAPAPLDALMWALLIVRLTFVAMLVALFFIDLEHQLLPNVITYPGIVLGLVASVWLAPGVASALEGAALGAGVLLAIRWLWKRSTGTDGMGLGDVKMLAMVGAVLGWPSVLFTLFVASISGAIVGLALARSGRGTMHTRIPFGTFLAVAAFAASCWGGVVMDWYLGLL